MDAKITEALVTAATAAVGWLVDAVAHHKKPDAAALKAAAIAAAEAAVKRGALELERLGVQVSLDTLALATQRAIDAIKVAASKPSLTDELLDGADVQQMPSDSHLDADGKWIVPEEPSPLESDAEPTKP